VPYVADSSPTTRIWAEFYEDNPSLKACAGTINMAWQLLGDVLNEGGQVLVCGNGGSASDSEHIAGELAKPCALARPLSEELRSALRAVGDDGYLGDRLQGGFSVLPLVSQAALITAIANDQGGDLIFAQQVVAYGRAGDLLWVLSTSGNSPNVIHALRTAKAIGMKTMGFGGPSGGEMARLCDVVVRLPGASVPAVQHSHQLTYHALCLAIEADRYAS
jgi:D-sedoheptulose 7-phosphate isomerase